MSVNKLMENGMETPEVVWMRLNSLLKNTEQTHLLVDVNGHRCEDFTLVGEDLVCTDCRLIKQSIYDNTSQTQHEVREGETSHVSLHCTDHEFFPEHSFASRVSFGYEHMKKAAPYSFKWAVWTNECYRDRVLGDLFRCLESVVLVMNGYRVVEVEAKRLLSEVVRNNVIRSNQHRQLCVYICVYYVMRQHGYVVDFDDFITKFELPVKLARKVLILYLSTLPHVAIVPLTASEQITIYLRRCNLNTNHQLHTMSLQLIDEVELVYGGYFQFQLKTQLAFTAAIVIEGVLKNPFTYTSLAFPVGNWKHRCSLKHLPSIQAYCQAKGRTLYTINRSDAKKKV